MISGNPTERLSFYFYVLSLSQPIIILGYNWLWVLNPQIKDVFHCIKYWFLYYHSSYLRATIPHSLPPQRQFLHQLSGSQYHHRGISWPKTDFKSRQGFFPSISSSIWPGHWFSAGSPPQSFRVYISNHKRESMETYFNKYRVACIICPFSSRALKMHAWKMQSVVGKYMQMLNCMCLIFHQGGSKLVKLSLVGGSLTQWKYHISVPQVWR